MYIFNHFGKTLKDGVKEMLHQKNFFKRYFVMYFRHFYHNDGDEVLDYCLIKSRRSYNFAITSQNTRD